MLNQRIWREDIYEKYGESAMNDHRDNLFLGIWEEIWETQNTEKPHFTRKIYDIVLFYPNSFPKKMFLGTFLGRFWGVFGKRRKDGLYEKEKLQRTV